MAKQTAEERKYAAQERRWQEDSDARTLGDAAAITTDPKRMGGAQRGAKRLQVEASASAKRQVAQAAALKKVAKGVAKPKVTAKAKTSTKGGTATMSITATATGKAKAPARSKPASGRKRR